MSNLSTVKGLHLLFYQLLKFFLVFLHSLPDVLFSVSLQRSARAAAEESDAVFSELIRSIELKRFEVRELIKAQEKTAIGEAEKLLEQIQKEIGELKKNEDELDKLSHAEDPIHFLQVDKSLSHSQDILL